MGRIRLEERLARSGAAEMDAARHHLDALVAAAQRLVAAAGHDPDRGDCASAGCGLQTFPDGDPLCATAHRLGVLRVPDADLSHVHLDVAVLRFQRALTEALDAVRTCRQTAHPSGACWFSAVPGVDGCGDVLRLAHRLS
jgi:hypothetical protein